VDENVYGRDTSGWLGGVYRADSLSEQAAIGSVGGSVTTHEQRTHACPTTSPRPLA
jgi:hypothetical protein